MLFLWQGLLADQGIARVATTIMIKQQRLCVYQCA
jgi:hypothetical protein